VIFVIEGHDLCGKTTVARRIGAEFGIPVVKPWADLSAAQTSLASVSRTLQSVVTAVGGNFVFDRFITSEYIYGPVCGRDTSYLDELLNEWVEIDTLCVLHSALSEPELIVRFSARGDHMFELGTVLDVRRRYERLPLILPSWLDYVFVDDIDRMRVEIARRLE
jgi:hypothetical protein